MEHVVGTACVENRVVIAPFITIGHTLYNILPAKTPSGT